MWLPTIAFSFILLSALPQFHGVGVKRRIADRARDPADADGLPAEPELERSSGHKQRIHDKRDVAAPVAEISTTEANPFHRDLTRAWAKGSSRHFQNWKPPTCCFPRNCAHGTNALNLVKDAAPIICVFFLQG